MENIYYIIGTVIFVINCLLMFKAKSALESLEWLISYKLANRPPDKSRINYRLVYLWLLFSVMSTLWLLFGLLTKDYLLFLFLSSVNLISNYLLSKHKGQTKIRLSFVKTVILNIILLSLVLLYWI
jgi:hypothetical protein